MFYSILGLSVYVSIVPELIQREDSYSIFRRDFFEECDCRVKCVFVDYLAYPRGKVKYIKENHFLVIIDDEENEYRCFIEYRTGTPYAVLHDSFYEKTLYINKQFYGLISESLLFNCMGLEKNLNAWGKMILHCSFVETISGAILFSAPSGTGKSTQADLWNKVNGSKIINGDRACVFFENNTWFAGGIPWHGTSGIINKDILPIRAVVFLEKGKDNTVTSLSFKEKIKGLMSQTTINPWVGSMIIDSQSRWLEFCESVPVFKYSCTKDESAVFALNNYLNEKGY